MASEKDFSRHRSDKLYGWLAENHKSQIDIAELLNVSVKTVNNKMLGKTDWKASEIRTICTEWNISSDVFY